MLKIILIVVCALSIGLFFTYESSKITTVTHGFASYYTFSRLLLEEEDFSRSYDTAYFNSKIKEYKIEGIRDLPNNIPTSAFLFMPVAALEPVNAKIVWTLLNFVFYLFIVWLLLKIFNLNVNDNKGLLLIAISFCFLPLYHCLSLGQAYVFLLLLFTISLYGLKRDNNLLTSLPIALMLVFKGYGIISLISLAFLKKWKEFFTTIIITILIILLTLPIIGLNTWNEYISTGIFQVVKNNYASSAAYQTLNSLFLNILPILSTIFLILAGILLLVIFLRAIPSIKSGELTFYSVIIILNVILAPIAEEYHYTLLLPSIFCIGLIIFDNYKSFKLESILFILALLLLSVTYNYKSLDSAGIPLVLAAYPRLYGGLIIILLYFLLIKKKSLKLSV